MNMSLLTDVHVFWLSLLSAESFPQHDQWFLCMHMLCQVMPCSDLSCLFCSACYSLPVSVLLFLCPAYQPCRLSVRGVTGIQPCAHPTLTAPPQSMLVYPVTHPLILTCSRQAPTPTPSPPTPLPSFPPTLAITLTTHSKKAC